MVAAFPTVQVEIAFTTAPLATTPTWTDVTSFVEWNDGATVKRGRTYETEEVQPSTFNLTLNNADGRFTAGNTASPYWPNVKPNRRIRIRATWNAVTYPLFDGYVDAWPTGWDGGVWAKVQVSATDRLKLLSRRTLRSMLEEETLATLDPIAYFPLTESSDATTASDISASQLRQAIQRVVGSGAGQIQFGSGVAVVDDQPSVQFTRASDGNGRVLYSRLPSQSVTGFSVSGWFAFPNTFQNLWRVSVAGGAGINADLVYVDVGNELAGTDDRTLRFYINSTQLGGISETAAQPLLANGRVHHIVCTAQFLSGSSWETRIYVDGVLAGGPNTVQPSSGTWGTIDELWMGGTAGSVSEASVGHVTLYDYALNTTQIQLLVDGANYYPDDLAGSRIDRLLSYDGIIITQTDTGQVTLGRQATTGQTIAAACGQAASTDGGVFFVDGAGIPTFHDRDHRSAAVNMVTNPSFETDISGWESPDGTLIRNVGQRHSGVASLQVTITDLTGTPLVRTASPFVLGVVGNRWYYVSAWDRLGVSGSRLVSARPVFLRTDNSITLNPTAVYTSGAAGEWVQRSSFHQAPSDAVKLQAVVAYNLSDAALSDIHQIDTVEVVEADFVLTADQLEGNLQFQTDESLIRNKVTVSRANGRQYQVTDATSITDHGQLDYSEDALLTNDRDASDRANYLLTRYAQPQPRASQIAVNLINKSTTEQTSLSPALLAADIGQRFGVTSLPTGAPAATAQLVVDGIEHRVGPDEWTVTLDTSPAPNMFIPRAFFKLDDAVLGKLDSGNFLGA